MSTEATHEDKKETKRGPGRPKLLKTGKPGRPKKIYAEHEARICCEEAVHPTVKEALSGQHSSEWKGAMKKEYKALEDNKTWTLVKRPLDQNVIGCRFVLKYKFNEHGQIVELKARLVAKGWGQIPGQDFGETYAPVARLGSIRLVIALAAEHGLQLFQMDVVMAYINGDLDEQIFMEQPEGFIVKGKEDHVLLLKKSLYGLKQAGRKWHEKLAEILLEIGLVQSNYDPSVYYKRLGDKILIVSAYVDDMICASNDDSMTTELKTGLNSRLKMKDLGKVNFCLGIEFNQDEEMKVTISQEGYIRELTKRFNMNDAKPMYTPLEAKIDLSSMKPASEQERAEMKRVPYRNLIGSLMYIAVSTRPDISHALSYLSRYNEDPGRGHWNAAKRVLQYLHTTASLKLKYCRTENQLQGFADSDWGSDKEDRISFTGYAFKLAGSAITWKACKQDTVAKSSAEAEYMSLGDATGEAVYLRNFLTELGFSTLCTGATTIFSDSQGAHNLTRNPVNHPRTKHIDIKHHYIREIYKKKQIDIEYLNTAEMPADVLTKSLGRVSHERCLIGLGLSV